MMDERISKYIKYGALITVFILISACTPVGGSCQYLDSAEIVQLRKLANPAEVQTENGEVFEIDPARLVPTAQVGQYFQLKLRRITNGSCTPIVISSLRPYDS
jgi:hypothetical protein